MTSPDSMPALAAGHRPEVGDHRASGRLHAEIVGDFGRDLLHLHADPASGDVALLFELVDHGLHGVAGMAKAMPTDPPEGE